MMMSLQEQQLLLYKEQRQEPSRRMQQQQQRQVRRQARASLSSFSCCLGVVIAMMVAVMIVVVFSAAAATTVKAAAAATTGSWSLAAATSSSSRRSLPFSSFSLPLAFTTTTTTTTCITTTRVLLAQQGQQSAQRHYSVMSTRRRRLKNTWTLFYSNNHDNNDNPQEKQKMTTTTSPSASSSSSSSLGSSSTTLSSSLSLSSSWKSYVSQKASWEDAVQELLQKYQRHVQKQHQQQQQESHQRNNNKENDLLHGSTTTSTTDCSRLAFLFVGQQHAVNFERIVQTMYAGLGATTATPRENNSNKDMNKEENLLSVSAPLPAVQMLSVVGSGVIGQSMELDEPTQPAISLLISTSAAAGIPNTAFELFSFNELLKPPPDPHSKYWRLLGRQQEQSQSQEAQSQPQQDATATTTNRRPSFLLFGDPWSPVARTIQGLTLGNPGSIVAGGISVPTGTKPTTALNDRCYSQGSLVGIVLKPQGPLALQVVTAQGCRPTGPVYRVTAVNATDARLRGCVCVTALDGVPAIQQLESMAAASTVAEQRQISSGLVCGILSDSAYDKDDDEYDDYLIRPIAGFVPAKSGIAVAGQVSVGDCFRFMVRDQSTAAQDLHLQLQRALTERWLLSSSTTSTATAVKPVVTAAFQFSCLARGRNLFGGVPNVDIQAIQETLQRLAPTPLPSPKQQQEQQDQEQPGEIVGEGEQGVAVPNNDDHDHEEEENDANSGPPIAGFYANGEIGPVGIAGFSADNKAGGTHVHGFSTVVAFLADYTLVDAAAAAAAVAAAQKSGGVVDSPLASAVVETNKNTATGSNNNNSTTIMEAWS